MKFAKPKTFIDKFGGNQDLIHYKKFYMKMPETIRNHMVENHSYLQKEQFEDVLYQYLVTSGAEYLWFYNHNPCYKVSQQVFNKMNDIDLPENIDADFLPFDAFMVVFPKNQFYMMTENVGKKPIDAVLISRVYEHITFSIYLNKDIISKIVDSNENVIDELKRTFAIDEHTDDLLEALKISLKIGLVASNEILTETEGKTLVKTEKNDNEYIVTDFKCKDYRRFLKPIYDACKSIGNRTRELHYQFTREGHWRYYRDSFGNILKQVWVKQALVRPDLPTKAELML